MLRNFSVHSLRVRLTLWNTCVVALILIALAGILRVVVAKSILDSVDADMRGRAQRSQDFVRVLINLAVKKASSSNPTTQTLTPGSSPTPTPTPAPSLLPPSDVGAPSRWQTRLVEKAFDSNGKRLLGAPDDPPLDAKSLTRSARGEEVFLTTQIEGESVRVFSAPLSRQDPSKPFPVIQIGYSLLDIERGQKNLDRTLLMLVPIGLLSAAAGGLFLTSRMLRPVREATKKAAYIDASDLSERLPVEGEDEFAQLAKTLNGMLARLEASFEQQKRFTADASHELRSPLTVVKSISSRVLARPNLPEEQRDSMERIQKSALAMESLIESLLFLARSDNGQLSPKRQPIPLTDLLEEVIDALSQGATPHVQNQVDEHIQVLGDRSQLYRLFFNLLDNAVRHTPQDGTVTFTAIVAEECVVITITDTGEGIASQHLPHITKRFYRVDTARDRERGGTGLGLAICQSIVVANDGDLQIKSAFGEGTRVSITIPSPN